MIGRHVLAKSPMPSSPESRPVGRFTHEILLYGGLVLLSTAGLSDLFLSSVYHDVVPGLTDHIAAHAVTMSCIVVSILLSESPVIIPAVRTLRRGRSQLQIILFIVIVVLFQLGWALTAATVAAAVSVRELWRTVHRPLPS